MQVCTYVRMYVCVSCFLLFVYEVVYCVLTSSVSPYSRIIYLPNDKAIPSLINLNSTTSCFISSSEFIAIRMYSLYSVLPIIKRKKERENAMICARLF